MYSSSRATHSHIDKTPPKADLITIKMNDTVEDISNLATGHKANISNPSQGSCLWIYWTVILSQRHLGGLKNQLKRGALQPAGPTLFTVKKIKTSARTLAMWREGKRGYASSFLGK